VEDNIDGGQIVAGGWFKIAHPMALKHVLGTMAWLPEIFGAARENHLMRSSSVVTSVIYGDGRVSYSTCQAPDGSIDVLRLAFRPSSVTAGGKPLLNRADLDRNGYQIQDLPGGDALVTIRHDGGCDVVVLGEDPQQEADEDELSFTGEWSASRDPQDLGGQVRVASAPGAAVAFSFAGNQVRLIGRVDAGGGLADIYVDDVKQLVGLDCWNPGPRYQQVLYYKNGLANGDHRLKVVARGAKNPLSQGQNVYIDAVQWSAATGSVLFGEGGGPQETQRMIFGYSGRTDYVDSEGQTWRPGTEFIVPAGADLDSVAASWWTERRRLAIDNTPDPELYRYGIHGRDFTVYFTVGPGQYHVRLKFAEARRTDPRLRAVTVQLNDREVVSEMDVVATAGGFYRAVDLVFSYVRPQDGVISLRFTCRAGGQAMVQAIEVGPGDGGTGAAPVPVGPIPARAPTGPR
jgi:Malectin domain